MEEKRTILNEKYFLEKDAYGIPIYEDDLRMGHIWIYDVPYKHRNRNAYIAALCHIRRVHENGDRDFSTERDLIQHMLMADILEAHKHRDYDREIGCRQMYYELKGTLPCI